MERRILEYYGAESVSVPTPVPAEESDEGKRAEGTLITIQEATQSEVFTIEEIEEDYLRLRGGVVLSMEEEETLHTVRADEITLNISANSLSATGGVEYTVTGPNGSEEFSGDSLVFYLDTWEGTFVAGVTTASSDEGERTFTVEGSRITRSANSVIIIEDGRITSSPADPPNYEIAARKIWILAPGEWGLRRAVLYVGRVPVFAFPFFFLPGDKLFFHPVAGTDTRNGAFIQTTTYVIGESEESDPPLSIMQLAESDQDEKRIREGLFLRVPEDPPPADPDGWSLKIMADYYTTLGLYGAVAGEHPGLWRFSDFSYRAGLARSRTIFLEGGAYSSFYVDQAGNAQRNWDRGYVLGEKTPLRFESEFDATASAGPVSLSVRYAYLSDSTFRSDFHSRREGFDWGSVLNPADDSEESDSSESVSTLRWEANGSWNPETDRLGPYVQSFSLSRLRTEVAWNVRSVDQSRLPEVLVDYNADSAPEESFFYPSSAVAPDAAASLRGTLFSWSSVGLGSDSSTSAEDEQREISIRPPWEESAPDAPETSEEVRRGDRLPDVGGLTVPPASTLTVSYSLSPSIKTDFFSDNADWQAPSDVEWAWRYGTQQRRLLGDLSLAGSYWENRVDSSSTVTFETRDQRRLGGEGLENDERDSVDLASLRYETQTVNHTSQANFRPLLAFDTWSASRLSYRLSNRLYRRTFTGTLEERTYDTLGAEWDREAISSHSVTGRVQADIAPGEHSFEAEAALPPLLRAYEGTVTSVLGPVRTTLNTGISEDEEGRWTKDALTQSHTVRFYDGKVSLDQQFRYDLETVELSRSSSSARLWPLRVTLLAQQQRGYTFDNDWEAAGETRLRFSSLTANLDASTGTRRGWKNRLSWEAFLDAGATFDLQRYTNSNLSLTYGTTLDLYRFGRVELKARTQNDYLYQYIPSLADEVGRLERSLVRDLRNSIAFWDREAREESFFKLKSIDVTFVHDLQDWELRMTYSGSPELTDEGNDYRWNGVFTILVEWQSIRELRRNVRYADDTVEFLD